MHKIFTSALFRQYAVVFAINLNCLGFGLANSWSSPALVKLGNGTETVLPQPLDQDEASWIVSVSFLTGSIGYVSAGALIDLLGRKYCLMISSVVRLTSALFFLFASEVWMLTLGRAFNGISDGYILAVIPIYSSEVASKEVRGALGTMLQIFTSIGSVIMLSVGPFISYFNLTLMLVLSILLTSMPLVFLPDSPIFLYSRGRQSESQKVLIFLRASEIQANEELKEYATNKNNEKLSLLAIFRDKVSLKSFGKGTVIIVLIYLIGFNCLMSYLQTILNTTQTSIKSEVASGIIGGIQLIASFSTMMATDRFGRKPILVSTLLGMTVGMVGLGTFFKLLRAGTEVSGFMNYLPLISLIIVVYSYSAGVSSLIWLVLAELFDDRSRGVGMSATLFVGSLPSFVIIKYFTALVDVIGEAPTFWMSAAFSTVLAVFIAYMVPETKGKSFAEIQHALGSRNKS